MYWIRKGLLVGAMLACVGCTNDAQQKLPSSPTPKKSVSSKPAENVPASVSKLLPPEQLNDRNAKAQAKALEDTLRREKGQLDKTESARAE